MGHGMKRQDYLRLAALAALATTGAGAAGVGPLAGLFAAGEGAAAGAAGAAGAAEGGILGGLGAGGGMGVGGAELATPGIEATILGTKLGELAPMASRFGKASYTAKMLGLGGQQQPPPVASTPPGMGQPPQQVGQASAQIMFPEDARPVGRPLGGLLGARETAPGVGMTEEERRRYLMALYGGG